MPSTQIKNIPGSISDSELLHIIKSDNVNWEYVKYVKEFSGITDELLSEWLNINVKTFRTYKKEPLPLKENFQEQVILLISLFRHGQEVFGEMDAFYKWLETAHFYLDGDKPMRYLNTITGIRFIDDRLTALEYGDNV